MSAERTVADWSIGKVCVVLQGEMTEAVACLSWQLKESVKIHINYD
jgi:hypothetical protein